MLPAAPQARMTRPAAPGLLRRALALVLLFGVAACAAPPGFGPEAYRPEMVVPPAPPAAQAPMAAAPSPFGKPTGGLRHAADIAGPACVAEHRQVIEEAVAMARERLTAGIRVIETQPDSEAVLRWFGFAERAPIADRLRRIHAWLGEPDNAKILCNDPPACQGVRMAYAAPSRRIVGLCPSFFRASLQGFDNRWGILIHEASHVAAGTQDFVYGPRAALVLAKQDPQRAAMNADNYEYYVETLARYAPGS
jgi:peptidyl-Lys metalloendopeptidase